MAYVVVGLPILLLLALVALSVQVGRRSVAGTIGRWRWPVAAVNLLAALLFPLMVADVAQQVGYQTLGVTPNTGNNTVQNGDGVSEGLPLVDANGESRWNVFPLRQRPLDPALTLPTRPSVDPLPSALPSALQSADPSALPSAD